MINKFLTIFLIVILIAAGISAGFFTARHNDHSFSSLSPEEMYKTIIEQRDYAIAKAVERGDYKCCIKPPCTMCYMEANKWNNFKAGTCACDDLIAEGQEPCPQCIHGFCEQEDNWFCSLD